MPLASTPFDSSDRVNLLMVFVPFLIAHSPVEVSQVAETFDLSESQVRELVSLLAVSGVPGEEGLYQHQDLFDINWDLFDEGVIELWNHVAVDSTPRFSAREAASLVAGLSFLSGVLQPELQLRIEQLLAKIAQGSSATPQNIIVDRVPAPESIHLLQQAIANSSTVRFMYLDSEAVASERVVSPVRIDVVGQTWYLRGWCHSRRDLRTFRCDRMAGIALSDTVFVKSVAPSDLPDELFTPQDDNILVSAKCHPALVSSLSEYQPVVTAATSEDFVTVSIQFADLSSVCNFALRFAGQIEISGPEVARAAVLQSVSSTIANMTMLTP